MKCSNCGKNIPDDVKFCGFCGTQVVNNYQQDNMNPGDNSRKKIIIIAAITIAVILAIIAGILLYRHFADKPTYSDGIEYSKDIEKPKIEKDYTAEDDSIYFTVPEIIYEDGSVERPKDYRVYLDGEKCQVDSGYIMIPDSVQGDSCDLRLEWDRDGEEYYLETEITLDDAPAENWRDALVSYVQNESDVENQEGYCLIYLDDNDIPELVEVGISEADGVNIINYSDGKINVQNLWRLGFTYIERGNLLNDANGNMGYYYDRIFSIVDGKMQMIAEGEYTDDTPDRSFEYTWNGESVSEEEYESNLNEVYDESMAIDGFYSFDELMSAEEIIEEIDRIYDETMEKTGKDKEGQDFASYLKGYLVGTWEQIESAKLDRKIEFRDDGTFYCEQTHDYMGDARYWGTWEVTSEDGKVYFKTETTGFEADTEHYDYGIDNMTISSDEIDEIREEIRDGKFEISLCRKIE